MGQDTSIEWATHSFNCWRGCTKISQGCTNCYAATFSKRNPLALGVWGTNGTRVVASEEMWGKPAKWNAAASICPNPGRFDKSHLWSGGVCLACGASRPRVFCASLADVFEGWVGPMVDVKGDELSTWKHVISPVQWGTTAAMPQGDAVYENLGEFDASRLRPLTMQDVRQRLFNLIDRTPNLDWLLVTKRPENITRMMPAYRHPSGCEEVRVRSNLWLGTSVENQAAADERIPHLLRVPAAVRFLSMEPLLGPVDLQFVKTNSGRNEDGETYSAWHRSLSGNRCETCVCTGETITTSCEQIDWVIVGGESGPHARPMHPDWARSLRDQCQAAGVAFHFKQWGEHLPNDHMTRDERIVASAAGKEWHTLQDGISLGTYRVGKKAAGRELDGRTHDAFPTPEAK